MATSRGIDCHVHIVDPSRYPYAEGPGYKPRPDEIGTREALCAALDAHRIRHALLVQPSCYGFVNAAVLDAMTASPGRFRAIVMVSPETPETGLAALNDAGVVGVRFNLGQDGLKARLIDAARDLAHAEMIDQDLDAAPTENAGHLRPLRVIKIGRASCRGRTR